MESGMFLWPSKTSADEQLRSEERHRPGTASGSEIIVGMSIVGESAIRRRAELA